MSNFPTLTQLGLILCILGLVATFPNEDNPSDIPLEGALDTAVQEPVNTIMDPTDIPLEGALDTAVQEPVNTIMDPTDIPLEGALDTAVQEPVNTIKDDVKDLGDPDNASSENSDSLEDTNPKCKQVGLLCFRRHECCSGHCHFFVRRCVYGDSLFGPHAL